MHSVVEPTVAPQPNSRRRRNRVVSGVGVLVLLVGAGWWSTHPDRFSAVGNGVGFDKALVGKSLLYGMFAEPSSSVTLRSATANVTENTAEADVRVVVCDPLPGNGMVGAGSGTARDYCLHVISPSGLRLNTLSFHRQLLVEITPHRPGRVVVNGVRLSYRSGLRWGTESTGTVVTVTVPGA